MLAEQVQCPDDDHIVLLAVAENLCQLPLPGQVPLVDQFIEQLRIFVERIEQQQFERSFVARFPRLEKLFDLTRQLVEFRQRFFEKHPLIGIAQRGKDVQLLLHGFQSFHGFLVRYRQAEEVLLDADLRRVACLPQRPVEHHQCGEPGAHRGESFQV